MRVQDIEKHHEHWTEPQSVTSTRHPSEMYCEFCGEEIPFHLSTCKLLKGTRSRQEQLLK